MFTKLIVKTSSPPVHRSLLAPIPNTPPNGEEWPLHRHAKAPRTACATQLLDVGRAKAWMVPAAGVDRAADAPVGCRALFRHDFPPPQNVLPDMAKVNDLKRVAKIGRRPK